MKLAIETLDAAVLARQSSVTDRLETCLSHLFPKRQLERVLLIVPPDGDVKNFNYATCKLGRYPNFPPYGMGILASRLRAEGFQVSVLNLNHEVLKACRHSEGEDTFNFTQFVEDRLTEALQNFKPQMAGVTCMFSQTHTSMVDVCRFLKKVQPELPIAIGGVHVTNSMMDEKTRPIFFEDLAMVDLFFFYESDLTFPAFARVVNRQAPLSALGQMLFNDPETKFHCIERQTPEGEDLDVIPAHDLITPPDLAENGKIGSYHMLVKSGTRFTTVLSNRGCRAQCTFCSVRNFNGMGVRTRSVQSVIDELLRLRHDFGIGHVMWLDDDFLKDPGRTMQLFNEIVRQDVGITWDCTNGVIAYSCTDEIIAAAAASGCVGLTIGMESGNPQILKEIKKPGTVDVFIRAAEAFRKHEQINSRVFLMIGFPHETFAMVRDTFEVAREMDLDWSFITPLQPLPNTPIFTQMALEGMIGQVVFDEIRYKLGAHGKQRKSTERRVNVFATDFNRIFEDADMNAIPTKEEINRLWAYLNYHLNFDRLFRERRAAKRRQMYQYLQFITEVVAPEDAFAHYFRAYLHHRAHGTLNLQWAPALQKILSETPEWQDRFREFGLHAGDLANGNFPEGAEAIDKIVYRRSA